MKNCLNRLRDAALTNVLSSVYTIPYSEVVTINKAWLTDPDFLLVIKLIKNLVKKYRTAYLFKDIEEEVLGK